MTPKTRREWAEEFCGPFYGDPAGEAVQSKTEDQVVAIREEIAELAIADAELATAPTVERTLRGFAQRIRRLP